MSRATRSMKSRRTTDSGRARRLALALLAGTTAWPVHGQEVTYADLAPLLNKRCAPCHSGPAALQGLQLDSYDGVLSGSARGAVVRAGDPEGSELIRRLTGASQPRMPLTGPPFLDDADIGRFRRWIAAGMPEGTPASPTAWSKPPTPKPTPRPPGTPVTWTDIAPLLATRCVKCHTDNGLMGDPPEGYRLTTHATTLNRGERARVVPGNPDASELVRRIRGQSRPRMPFDGPPFLTAAEIALVEQWVAEGARDASGAPAATPTGARVRFEGTLGPGWTLDGLPLRVTSGTRIDKRPGPGDHVEVRGRIAANGSVVAERIRRR